MDKKEQLAEYITQDIVAFIVEDDGADIETAIKVFFESETYSKLLDFITGLYLESSAYVYEIFKDEMKDGRIIQKEI